MSNRRNEIKQEIYKLMDQAGLDAGTLSNAKMPLHQIVNRIRTELAIKLSKYIEEQPKKIEVEFND